jgi:hypothetical protein
MPVKKKIKKIKWDDVIHESTKTDIEYRSTGTYQQGEIINHNMFGLGVVTESLSSRVEVLFKDKTRTLIHNFMY